jgi:serine/threonine-protein kinase
LVADRSEADAELAVPSTVHTLARYRLIAVLARGGMGIVYLALVRGPGGFNKLFVVKELKRHFAEDPLLVSMFLEEARLSAKLNHPNVVQAMEVGSEAERHYIAMEYLEGQSLHRILQRGRRNQAPMPLRHQLGILASVLEGLHYAHNLVDLDGTALNLVHRDVSPSNVFVTFDGQVKVLDFGLAKALDSSHQTRTGMLKGKVAYMAPEQAEGRPAGRQTDIFATGVILWEAVAERRLWADAGNDLKILHALVNRRVPSLASVRPDAPEELLRIVDKAMAIEPADRYADAKEMQADLEAHVRGMEGPAFGPREIGAFVADLFAAERAKLKHIIDEQLKKLRGTESAAYGAIDMPQVSLALRSLALTPSQVAAAGSSERPPPAPAVSHAPPRKRSLFGPMLGVLGVLAMASIVTVVLVFRKTPTTSPRADTVDVAESNGPRPAEPTPSVAAAAGASTATVRITITVTPAYASVYVDDVKASGNPFVATFAQDGATHHVRGEARGFLGASQDVVANADSSVMLSLSSARFGGLPVRPSTGGTKPTATTTATGRPVRPIDTSNPYQSH